MMARTSTKFAERRYSEHEHEIERRDMTARDDLRIGLNDIALGAFVALCLVAAMGADKIADALYAWGF